MSCVKKILNFIAICIALGLIPLGKGHECIPRDFGRGSVVCVCNSTYCDGASVEVPPRGQYRRYESNKDGRRMKHQIGHFVETTNGNEENAIPIMLRASKQFQTMHGFGGAFTDATGINMQKLSKAAQDRIIESYFGNKGSRYTLGRVPAGGTDFSTRPYTYDDHPGDVNLAKFALAQDDYEYKIPLMKKARNLRPEMKFVSAAWTAPPWMKTNDNYTGYGFLKPEYYQTFADYLVKFLMDYKKEGLEMWAISTGNEPNDILGPMTTINTMGWTPDTMAQFVANNLGPTIASSGSKDTAIFVLDDQRYALPWYVEDVFRNPIAKNYTTAIAVHWYFDAFIVPQVLDATHEMFPDKFLLLTEGCLGMRPWDSSPVSLGDWSRAEKYALMLMDNFNHWFTGYIDWNLVLDQQGGPNWNKNFVDAPIIVNPANDEFFKQPIYYAIAHFSKFLPPGSRRIGIAGNDQVRAMAFSTPDDENVIILYNKSDDENLVRVMDPGRGDIFTAMSPRSIQTIIYKH